MFSLFIEKSMGMFSFSFCFLVLVLVSFSEQLWLFNGQVEDSTVGDYFLPT